MNISNYLFEKLRLASQQTNSDKLFRFDCNTVIQNQNVEKGTKSISSTVYPVKVDHILT